MDRLRLVAGSSGCRSLATSNVINGKTRAGLCVDLQDMWEIENAPSWLCSYDKRIVIDLCFVRMVKAGRNTNQPDSAPFSVDVDADRFWQ